MLAYLPEFYILLLVWETAHSQACNDGWFGQGCNLMCHCLTAKTCDKEGHCPNDDVCQIGYFGPGCQYVDVLQMNTSIDDDHFLRDWDDTTCNPQPDADVVVVHLTTPITFTWLRMVLNDTDNLLKFNATFNGSKPCKNDVKFLVNDSVVDLICDRMLGITSLQISGPAAGSVCSIYISGGRNVALKQRAEQSSTYQSQVKGQTAAANAVDGHSSRELNSSHCSSTDYRRLYQWWKLTFKRLCYLSKVIIHNRSTFQHRLTRFNVETYDEESIRITVHAVSTTTALDKYEIPISSDIPAKYLKVTTRLLPNNKYDRTLTICEVEAFGDPICPEGTFGFNCEKKCRCNATEACEPFTGTCTHGCQSGFYGLNCSIRCGHNCLHQLCEYYSGKCLACFPGYLGDKCDQACTPGSFGQDCTHSCSDGCATVCDVRNGNCVCLPQYIGSMCSECSPFVFGSNCDMNCSDECGDEGCDRLTGDCLTCAGNRDLPSCQDCLETFYGPRCDLRCHRHCLNRTCDQLSGECFACIEGYEGPQCQKIEAQLSELLFMAPMLFVQLLLLLFCVSTRKSEVTELTENYT